MNRRKFVTQLGIAAAGSVTAVGSAAAGNEQQPTAAELGLYDELKDLIQQGRVEDAHKLSEEHDIPHSRKKKTRSPYGDDASLFDSLFTPQQVNKGGSSTDLSAFQGTDGETLANLSFELNRNNFGLRDPQKAGIAIGWSETALRPVAGSEGGRLNSNLGTETVIDSDSCSDLCKNKDVKPKGYLVQANSDPGSEVRTPAVKSGQIYLALEKRDFVDFPVTLYSNLKHTGTVGTPNLGISMSLGKAASIAVSGLGELQGWNIEENMNYSP